MFLRDDDTGVGTLGGGVLDIAVISLGDAAKPIKFNFHQVYHLL